jgi:branched-chain amino acid transport system permease protein
MLTAYSGTITLLALTALFAYSYYAVLMAGQLSLGQAGLASLGGFTAVALIPEDPALGFVPPLAIGVAVGLLVGAAAAFVLGLPVMRLRGVFLAIATLGFGEMVRVVLINMDWTGGAQGTMVPKLVTPMLAWSAVTVVAYVFWRMGPSRHGQALAAIREDELVAQAMGIDISRHRMAAFVTSGALAGLYGVLMAYFTRFLAPDDFGFAAAVDGLVTAVVGGSLLFIGPILGSAFFTLIPEVQRAAGVEAGWVRPFLLSLLLLVVILFAPGGLAGLIPRWRARSTTAREALPLPPLPPAGTELLSLDAVGKDYGGVHAVRDVTLRVRSGEIVGLIGPNGAGKTTLVNIISGHTLPTSGTGTVLGRALGAAAPHDLTSAGVSRTFQQSKLFDRLTVLQNVLVGAHTVSRGTLLRRLLWLPSARRDERRVQSHALAQIERVGIDAHTHTLARNLAYGDRRRLEIARALAAHPSLLILDEPAAGMNHVEARELSTLIRSLAADGITVLLIEHNVRMVLETCQRIVVLDFGIVIAEGPPEQIARDPRVIDAYLGDARGESVG